jgi:hypothetical protein
MEASTDEVRCVLTSPGTVYAATIDSAEPRGAHALPNQARALLKTTAESFLREGGRRVVR